MPYSRPTLTSLRAQVLADIASANPGSDPLLRYSNLNIMGIVQASMAHLHYGYLDWIAGQAVPFTATDEYLEGWGALKGVFRNPAARATGTVRFTGTGTPTVPSGTPLTRGDGKTFTTTSSGTMVAGVVDVTCRADADLSGLTGAWGNCDAGTQLTIATAIANVNSTGIVQAPGLRGGADLETNDAFRDRVLFAYQNPVHGGSRSDYVQWAKDVSGVTRAWCVPNGAGPGTVSVYVMLDVVEAIHGGFPQGTNGVSQYDVGPPPGGGPRDTVATGDQLIVADAIVTLEPATALVYVLAPTANVVNFVLSGTTGWSAATKTAVEAAIDNVFLLYADITAGSSIVDLSYVEAAIAAVPGTAGFVITTPSGNITSTTGHIPTRGSMTYNP